MNTTNPDHDRIAQLGALREQLAKLEATQQRDSGRDPQDTASPENAALHIGDTARLIGIFKRKISAVVNELGGEPVPGTRL